MRRLTINGNDVNIPQSWGELSFGAALDWITFASEQQSPRDFYLKSVSVITGLPVDFWAQYTDLEQYESLKQWASFLYDNDQNKHEVEAMESASMRPVEFEGKTYRFPTDLGTIPVGLYEDAKGVISAMVANANAGQEEGDDREFNLRNFLIDSGTLFKLMLQVERDGEYDSEKAMAIDISGVPYAAVLAWRGFFFQKLTELQNGIMAKSRKSNTPLRRLLRVIRR